MSRRIAAGGTRSSLKGAVAAIAVAAASLGWCGRVVAADDLVNDSIPRKWINPLLPEKLPPLKYPDYFSAIDKAQAQWFAGRYKLSLITLARLHEVKPEQQAQVALIKGRSLYALGRTDEALSALSDAAVAADPDVQVERA